MFPFYAHDHVEGLLEHRRILSQRHHCPTASNLERLSDADDPFRSQCFNKWHFALLGASLCAERVSFSKRRVYMRDKKIREENTPVLLHIHDPQTPQQSKPPQPCHLNRLSRNMPTIPVGSSPFSTIFNPPKRGIISGP